MYIIVSKVTSYKNAKQFLATVDHLVHFQLECGVGRTILDFITSMKAAVSRTTFAEELAKYGTTRKCPNGGLACFSPHFIAQCLVPYSNTMVKTVIVPDVVHYHINSN